MYHLLIMKLGIERSQPDVVAHEPGQQKNSVLLLSLYPLRMEACLVQYIDGDDLQGESLRLERLHKSQQVWFTSLANYHGADKIL